MGDIFSADIFKLAGILERDLRIEAKANPTFFVRKIILQAPPFFASGGVR